MQCYGCGFSVQHNMAPPDHRCLACGKDLKRDADDFLLHGAEGLVKASRAGQVQMARAVEKTLATDGILLVEGPVGVGKSFAYLLPALLSGKRAVVSTAQKPLQSQLADKDGPRLAQAVLQDNPKARVAMLKGKSNYGCLIHANITSDVPEYAAWLRSSPTADLAEYSGARPARLHDATADGCVGARCAQAGVCGYRRAKEAAMTASVLVVNHSLAAFDLRFGPGSKMFGPYDTLIVDEAHKAPAAFRGAFEESLSERGVTRILKRMDALAHVALPTTTAEVSALWTGMFKAAKNLRGTLNPDPLGHNGDQTLEVLEELRAFADKHLGVLNRSHIENGEDAVLSDGIDPDDFSSLLGLSRSLHRATAALKLLKEPTKNTLLTADAVMGQLVFKATPVSVGALVGDQLGQIKSLIFTSATMAINNSFAAFRRELGLNRLETDGVKIPGLPDIAPKPIQELVVQSPFDYKAQGAFLYIPKHVKPAVTDGIANPEARDAYIHSLAKEVLALVRASGGNALVLFTATADLKETYEYLEAYAPEIPWITQNVDTGLGADAVLRKFHETPGGVILGLKSFWEGVSVEGDKLWLVIVTKLPFPSPADPLNRAQVARFEAELKAKGVPVSDIGFATFQQLAMPPMLTDMRQGAGRLVRTTTDRGVLAVLDTRIWTGKTGAAIDPKSATPRGYGATVLKALGFAGNWTPDFSYVAAKFKQWKDGTP